MRQPDLADSCGLSEESDLRRALDIRAFCVARAYVRPVPSHHTGNALKSLLKFEMAFLIFRTMGAGRRVSVLLTVVLCPA